MHKYTRLRREARLNGLALADNNAYVQKAYYAWRDLTVLYMQTITNKIFRREKC